MLGYVSLTSSYTKRGKGRDDKEAKTRYSSFWIGPEPTFEEEEALFTKYKIVNRVHNMPREYHQNKGKKVDPKI